ncbi:MAG: pyridoxal 5'-phosphate synthase glutaminase subunit PdxT [Clostridiales bacterium]|nr:pyridoxal 5'-phosphate synthase glutaminase subunit PdxT [Clostridiales bacterium]
MMIGVLALQGGFIEHINTLNKLGIDSFEIRKLSDLENKQIDGLILPGGESTVIGKLLRETGLFAPIKEMIDSGVPVFGTCAGMILLANKLENDPSVYFGAIDITVKRNAFGRQLGSFHTVEEFQSIGSVPMTFIRAPYISEASDVVEILAASKGNIVAARQRNVLVTSFHPELTGDLSVHKYFLSQVCGKT